MQGFICPNGLTPQQMHNIFSETPSIGSKSKFLLDVKFAQLQSNSELGQDILNNCLAIQTLQPALSPHDTADNSMEYSPGPVHDIYPAALIASTQTSQSATATGTVSLSHPSSHHSPGHNAQGSPLHPPPQIPLLSAAVSERTAGFRGASFYGQLQTSYPPNHADTQKNVQNGVSCNMVPPFEDCLSPTSAGQAGLGIFHRTFSGHSGITGITSLVSAGPADWSTLMAKGLLKQLETSVAKG
ncbi:zinc finger protein GLIS3-like [Pitangus sulphuratus]|nr:zinc finger protein GLIS3-like [Pitangus sulphuratus]